MIRGIASTVVVLAVPKMRSVEPETNPLGPKKTVLVIATVIGCIGILWPKVFHPMLSGGSGEPSSDPILPPGLLKDRGPGEYSRTVLSCSSFYVAYDLFYFIL